MSTERTTIQGDGELSVVLVDDQSRDATAQVARDAAAHVGKADRLTVLSGRALPAGWTGKLWALNEGVGASAAAEAAADTDGAVVPASIALA